MSEPALGQAAHDYVLVLNGPNLNLLGTREPRVYGSTTLTEIVADLKSLAGGADPPLRIEHVQSNHEGQLIDWIHEARERPAGVVINPAGLSFRSIPLLDALKILEQPIVEIHVTQIHKRGGLYRESLVSTVSDVVICGAGTFGYELALRAMADRL